MATAAKVSPNLPVQLTSFVGREAELDAVSKLLDGERLVTLSGAGGSGKTRLALEVATRRDSDVPGGVWFVELAPITDAEWVTDAIRVALGLAERPGMDPIEAVALQLPDHCLLVLDNCEHVIEGAAGVVSALLRGDATLTVLATSRQPLGIPGETTWRVPTMDTPPDPEGATPEAVGPYESVRLFVERARSVRQDFALTTANARMVGELVRSLDGIPLAIELAAARTSSLSLERISTGLADRFALLNQGKRTVAERHQTLAASVDWSYQLLSPDEQLVWGRLSIFAGGFTVDAAEVVVAPEDLAEGGLADVLAHLVDSSIVQVEEQPDGEYRYSMLETMRQFGRARLVDDCSLGLVRDRHLAWVQDLAARAEPELTGADQPTWLNRVEAEHENVRLALAWADEQDRTDIVLAVAADLTFFWKLHAHLVEGKALLARGLDRARATAVDPPPRAQWSLADLLYWSGAYREATELAHDALTGAAANGDLSTQARAVWTLANLEMFTVSPRATGTRCDAAIALARAAGDIWCLGVSLQEAAFALVELGLDAQAEPYVEEAKTVAAASGSPQLAAWNWALAQRIAVHRANFTEADRCFDRGIELADALDDSATGGQLIWTQSISLHRRGRESEAVALLETGLAALQASGALHLVPIMQFQLGLYVRDIDPARAQVLLAELDRAAEGVALFELLAVVAAVGAADTAGDRDLARTRVERCVELARRSEMCEARVTALLFAGLADLTDDVHRAEGQFHEALRMSVEADFPMFVAETLVAVALASAIRGIEVEAVRMLGAASARLVELGATPAWPRLFDQVEAVGRQRLGPDGYDAALAEGAAMGIDAAVALAQRTRGARGRPPSGWASLTPAEARVVALAAEGLTNPQIGERLFVSAGTVKTHLAHAFTKLGVGNRTELAAAVARHENAS